MCGNDDTRQKPRNNQAKCKGTRRFHVYRAGAQANAVARRMDPGTTSRRCEGNQCTREREVEGKGGFGKVTTRKWFGRDGNIGCGTYTGDVEHLPLAPPFPLLYDKEDEGEKRREDVHPLEGQ
jgi:hypothetical protein